MTSSDSGSPTVDVYVDAEICKLLRTADNANAFAEIELFRALKGLPGFVHGTAHVVRLLPDGSRVTESVVGPMRQTANRLGLEVVS